MPSMELLLQQVQEACSSACALKPKKGKSIVAVHLLLVGLRKG